MLQLSLFWFRPTRASPWPFNKFIVLTASSLHPVLGTLSYNLQDLEFVLTFRDLIHLTEPNYLLLSIGHYEKSSITFAHFVIIIGPIKKSIMRATWLTLSRSLVSPTSPEHGV